MKHYVKFINNRCFVDFVYKDRIVRKSLSIVLSDSQKKEKLRRIVYRLIAKHNINENNVQEALNELIIDKLLNT